MCAIRAEAFLEISKAEAEGNDMYNALTDRQWKMYRSDVTLVKAWWMIGKHKELMVPLCRIDDFIRRHRLDTYPYLEECGIPNVFMEIAVCEDAPLRNVAVSCISSLTGFVGEFLLQFPMEQVCHAIYYNMAMVKESKGCVFRWLVNIIRGYDNGIDAMIKSRLSEIVDTAIEYWNIDQGEAPTYLMYVIVSSLEMDREVMEKCVSFFIFLANGRISKNILLGISAILENENIPDRGEIARTFQIPQVVSTMLDLNRNVSWDERALAVVLIADVAELGIHDCDALIMVVLDHWHGHPPSGYCHVFDTIKRIADVGDAETVGGIWNYKDGIFISDLIEWMTVGSYEEQRSAFDCFASMLFGIGMDNHVIASLRPDVFDGLSRMLEVADCVKTSCDCLLRIIRAKTIMGLNDGLEAFCETLQETLTGLDNPGLESYFNEFTDNLRICFAM